MFTANNSLSEEESKAVVVSKKHNTEVNKRKVFQAFDIMKNGDVKSIDDRSNHLFNIILKLKEKGEESKNSRIMSYQQDANDRINKLTLQLIDMRTELEKTKKKNRELDAQVNTLKRAKVELETQVAGMQKEKSELVLVKQKVVNDKSNKLDLEQLNNDVDKYQEEIKNLKLSIKDKECLVSLIGKGLR